MRQRVISYVLCLIIFFSGYIYSQSLGYEKQEDPELISRGVVLEVREISDGTAEADIYGGKPWAVKVKITQGLFKERVVDTIHYRDENPAYDFEVKPNDQVVLSLETDGYILKEAYISSLARDKYLLYLLVLFLFSILAIGAKQGVKTIISLFITGWSVINILLPAILAGKDPISVTILVCAGITVITHLLITGLTKKSLAAVGGTIAGIMVGGFIAKYVLSIARINALSTEESRMLFYSFTEGQLDFTGLLFAGIVLGSLGAVMDVAMSIASSVNELNEKNPQLTISELVKSGLNIGRDVIGTMANTLILAYTGSALPLMLLLLVNDISVTKFINLDMIASEIIRALSGSIGLFMAVPFTAFLSGLLYRNKKIDTAKETW